MSSYGRIKGARAAILCPAHQADAVLSQANPVSTTLYEVLAVNSYVRIIGMEVDVTWTVQPSPLELILTIDGRTLTFTVANPASGVRYAATLQEGYADAWHLLAAGAYCPTKAFLAEGRSVRVQARTTGGTVSNLSARIIWARW